MVYDLDGLNSRNLKAFYDTYNGFDVDERDLCTPLNTFIPMPVEMRTPFGYDSDGYAWAIKNWGSKWSEHNFDDAFVPLGLQMSFDTAWGPSLEGTRRLSELFPRFVFGHSYEESGMGFMGSSIFFNGDVVWETCLEGDEYHQPQEDEYDEDDEFRVLFVRYHGLQEENMVISRRIVETNRR
jgi:hypothetical protein